MCPYEEVSEYIGSLSLNLDSISNGLKSKISLIISDNIFTVNSGISFTGMTDTVNACDADKLPSDTEAMKSSDP